MPALGPRVGGAHVDVNLKFDDKSVATVGKRVHQQLSKLNKSLAKVGDRNRELYRSIGRDAVTAWRSLLGVIVSGAPLMGSAISGVAGAATMLAGALYSTVQASYALAPVLASIGVAAGTAYIGLGSFFKALKSGELDALTPSAKAAAQAVQGLGGAWQKVADEIQERLFKGLADDIARLGTTLLPALQRGLGLMADSLNGLAKDMLAYVNSAAGIKVINKFLKNSADIFARFAAAVVPFLDGFLRLMNALAPAGKRLADRISDIANRFQGWTKGEGFGKRIDDMMRKSETTAGLLLKTLGNLGSAITNIFSAANPATNTFLEMLVGMTQRFEDWTASVSGQNSIAQWASQSVDVMRQFGMTLEAVFKVIAELADPRVIISFLKTVEGAFNYLAQLPLDKIVTAFVNLSEVLQPVSSLFLAIIIAGATLNILIGSLIGQLGGVASVVGRLVRPLARIPALFKPIGDGAKHAKALTPLGSALTRISWVVGRFAKFIPFVGWAATFAIVIARSDKLRAKFGELWDAIKGFGGSFKEAFGDIAESLKPLKPAADGAGKALAFIADKMDFWLGLVAENSMNALIHTFQGLANIVRGLGEEIAGIIDVFVGLFTLDGSKMLDGLGKIGSGILTIFLGLGETLLAPLLASFETLGGYIVDGLMAGLKGIGTAIAEFGLWIVDGVKKVLGINSPSTVFMQIGVWLIQGLISGVTSMGSLVIQGFSALVSMIMTFMAGLPMRLVSLGARAITFLGRSIGQNAPKVLQAVGRLYFGIVKSILRLPGRLATLGIRAITRLGGAVVKATPKVLSAAGKIFSGVVNWISKLPGRLSSLGKSSISGLERAFRSGIGSLKGIAGNIVTNVVNIIKGLPGKLKNLGSDFLAAGKTLGSKILDGIQTGISTLGDMAGSVASRLKNGINNAIGLPKEMSFKVFKQKIGFTIPGFAKGTDFAPGGLALVGERGPELVNLPRGSKVHTNAESQRMMGSGLPKSVILRVGARDFVAYVEEIADDRIDAADSLAWQGA